MKEYIDSFGIANTVRMTRSFRRGSRAALVQRESDVALVNARIGQHGYHAIPACSWENLIGAVELLAGDGWVIACASVTGAEGRPGNSPVPLQRFPWFAGSWKEIAEDARQLVGSRACLAVLPVEEAQLSEPLSGGEEETVPFKSRRRGGTSKTWAQWNARRVFLIKKQLQQSLTAEEQEELERLQSEMSRQINAAHPLPFDALDRLEEYIDQAERRSSGK